MVSAETMQTIKVALARAMVVVMKILGPPQLEMIRNFHKGEVGTPEDMVLAQVMMKKRVSALG